MTIFINSKNNDAATIEPTHLKDYLDYYKNLKNPGYGILVTGDWGIGKTFQVKEALRKDEYHYISLFGAQTTDEIYSSVYAKMYPRLSKTRRFFNTTDGAGVGPINIGNMLSGVANALIRENVSNDKIIIFDDLERCSISTSDLMGVFNKYIEHHECRVIVLAHDKIITENLKLVKEKVFGQTIEVTPQTSKAFDRFTDAIINPESRNLIKNLKDNIIEIFNQSNAHSLRILKHSLEDLSRLYENISETYKKNEAATLEFTTLFIALSLEVRAGRLKETDIRGRSESIIRYNMISARKNSTPETPAIYNSSERYKTLDLGNTILKDCVLIDLLIKGIYSKSSIENSLSESLHFTRPDDLPAWLVFMKFDELSDAESSSAAEKLKAQFESRALVEPGELLHLFSLRFLLSEMGLVEGDLNDIEEECRLYMDDLLAQDRVKTKYRYGALWDRGFSPSYGGYGYWVEESYTEHFKRTLSYLDDIEKRAERKRHPEIAKQILSLMSDDGEKFAEKISYTNNGQNDFAAIDVLASIEPSDFVQQWMGAPAKNWRHICRGLEQRYSSGQLSSSLSAEHKWMCDVIDLIEREIKKSVGIRKKRIQRILPHSLRRFFGK